MKYFKIPSNPKELFGKIKLVVKHFLFSKGMISKFQMHRAVLRSLALFRKEKLVYFRTTLMYILPYLSKSFNTRQKQSILIDHYSFLKKFTLFQLRQLFRNGLEVYSESSDDDNYSIVLKSVITHLEFEGSMCLLFKQNDITLFSLNFTFIKGESFGIDNSYVIYVSALQGVKNTYEQIRRSTKHFKENSLPVILLKTLETIAFSLDIKQCVGISAHKHLSLKDTAQYERFFNNYDAFWTNNGATLVNDNYLLKFPLAQKPILEIAQTHRNRTLKKRKKLQEVSDDVSKAMFCFLQNANFLPKEDIAVMNNL